MRRILCYVIGTVVVFYGWHHYRQARFAEDDMASAPDPVGDERGYRCDGHAFCSQMHSCEEATWFLQHCPKSSGASVEQTDRQGVVRPVLTSRHDHISPPGLHRRLAARRAARARR